MAVLAASDVDKCETIKRSGPRDSYCTETSLGSVLSPLFYRAAGWARGAIARIRSHRDSSGPRSHVSHSTPKSESHQQKVHSRPILGVNYGYVFRFLFLHVRGYRGARIERETSSVTVDKAIKPRLTWSTRQGTSRESSTSIRLLHIRSETEQHVANWCIM